MLGLPCTRSVPAQSNRLAAVNIGPKSERLEPLRTEDVGEGDRVAGGRTLMGRCLTPTSRDAPVGRISEFPHSDNPVSQDSANGARFGNIMDAFAVRDI
jgi:hypothetical protein